MLISSINFPKPAPIRAHTSKPKENCLKREVSWLTTASEKIARIKKAVSTFFSSFFTQNELPKEKPRPRSPRHPLLHQRTAAEKNAKNSRIGS